MYNAEGTELTPKELSALRQTMKPSPAALAAATRLTEEIYHDVYKLANFLDAIAEEARENERRRILSMTFMDIFREFWQRRKLQRK